MNLGWYAGFGGFAFSDRCGQKRLVEHARAGCVEFARRRKVRAFLRRAVNGLLRMPR